jgi:hypothetical protein
LKRDKEVKITNKEAEIERMRVNRLAVIRKRKVIREMLIQDHRRVIRKINHRGRMKGKRREKRIRIKVLQNLWKKENQGRKRESKQSKKSLKSSYSLPRKSRRSLIPKWSISFSRQSKKDKGLMRRKKWGLIETLRYHSILWKRTQLKEPLRGKEWS